MEQADENIKTIQQRLATDFNIPAVASKTDLLHILAEAINHLITIDFNRLLNILYRIDISEDMLKKQLLHQNNTDAGLLIADMIVERELQKQLMRNQFKQQHDIPDDDKW